MRASLAATDNRSKSVRQLLGVSVTPMLSPQPHLPQRSTEKTGWNNETLIECHDDEINGERFGTVLGTQLSFLSNRSDPRKVYQLESKQKVGNYSAVKRVFSMRRSASVSERYCRIPDQSNMPTAYFEGEGSMDEETGSPMKPVKQQQHKGGKTIKACKRFFNLK